MPKGWDEDFWEMMMVEVSDAIEEVTKSRKKRDERKLQMRSMREKVTVIIIKERL